MNARNTITIAGQIGVCGHLSTFLGFAPARILHACSFADVLNEDTGHGYQRPMNAAHSRSFRQYILQDATSTIPLTFNLRADRSDYWQIERRKDGRAILHLVPGMKALAQVDCQHRLGEMGDQAICFAFMAFIGLDLRSEMAMFNIINSRAKGLSSSLTDFHQTRLIDDLALEAPHLLIAKRLNEDADSPWYRMIKYGGETSSGLMRRTSFRMMQTSVRKLLRQMEAVASCDVDLQYAIIVSYWKSIRTIFKDAWTDHRHHLITKGVGLYALSLLLGDLIQHSLKADYTEHWFLTRLEPMAGKVDWSSQGVFATAGGKKGASEVHMALKKVIGI